MSRQILYIAAPLRPTEEEIAERLPGSNDMARREAIRWATKDNLDRAMRWLSWLRRSFPETTFIAPWIAAILAGADDTDPAQREAGFADDCAVIERCDGIVLCGGRISEGMQRERVHGEQRAWRVRKETCPPFEVYDLVSTSNRGICDKGEPPAELYRHNDGDFSLAGSWSTPVLYQMERIWRISQ